MNEYFIKIIDGPEGQKGYPKDNLIHFTTKNSCERFKECGGFLIYETGGYNQKEGLMTIYAYGSIDPEQPQYIKPVEARGRHYPYGVKVKLSKHIPPKNGVPLDKIREITKIKKFQRPGGILKITKEQFDDLCTDLDKRSQNLS